MTAMHNKAYGKWPNGRSVVSENAKFALCAENNFLSLYAVRSNAPVSLSARAGVEH